MVWQQDLAIYSVSIKQITTNEISVKNKIKYFGGKEMTQQEIQEKMNCPKLRNLMPKNFDYELEAQHLFSLIEKCSELKSYTFDEFICAGGSGMVFKVKRLSSDDFYTAIKIVRKHVFENKDESPFSNADLEALKELSHPNIVRLYDTVKIDGVVIAVCTSYIENAQGIDRYIQDILNKIPKPSPMRKSAFNQVSIERLEKTCETVTAWIYEISQAIAYMHSQGYYHLDIKPANILIQGTGTHVNPIITDMGSCIKADGAERKRVHFTWAYAHPDLTDIKKGDPGSIEGGALRASARVCNIKNLQVYDLYAFGKTIQQILAVIDMHFGEVCYACYPFRYLHIISALLLDGQNRIDGEKKGENVYEQNGIRFVSSFPMNLSSKLLASKKIRTSAELVQRLRRINRDYSIVELAPEFDSRCSNIINNTIGEVVPFTKRVSKVFNHPIMKRLYNELQLGLMTEIYPGASHNRWSHSLGVFAIVVKYYESLLSDPGNPLLKIIINEDDISHAFLAAIMHDIGHTSVCHDLEAANGKLFDHLSYMRRMVEDVPFGNKESLFSTIQNYWGKNINLDRIINIVIHKGKDPVDEIASDCIDGPIDADKLDYIKRDSYYCGVSYGDGIDYGRIMNSLTICEKKSKLRLSYYAKGRTAISSLLLARYQLYGSVYWHHTYRCLHALLYYSTFLAFKQDESFTIKVNQSRSIRIQEIRELYYYRVLRQYTWEDSWKRIDIKFTYLIPALKNAIADSQSVFPNNYSLGFIYVFTNELGKDFLKELKERNIYKRIYSKNMRGIDTADFSEKCRDRIKISQEIQESLFEAIKGAKNQSDRNETAAEVIISKEIKDFGEEISNGKVYIILDFPKKIQINSNDWPSEISDSARGLQSYGTANANEVVNASNSLLSEVANIRVYAEPDFYNLITRYLSASTIEDCVNSVLNM